MYGYKTKEPCCICGKVKNNIIEPRFNYVVCEDHCDIPPAKIHLNRRDENED